MPYALTFALNIGTAGLTLRGALTTTGGAPHATVRDIAVTEIAQGFYQLAAELIPDGYAGAMVIYTGTLGTATNWTGTTIRSCAAVNPQEHENSNEKTSLVPGRVWTVTLGTTLPGTTGHALRLMRGFAGGQRVVRETVSGRMLDMYDIDGATVLTTWGGTPPGGPFTGISPQ